MGCTYAEFLLLGTIQIVLFIFCLICVQLSLSLPSSLNTPQLHRVSISTARNRATTEMQTVFSSSVSVITGTHSHNMGVIIKHASSMGHIVTDIILVSAIDLPL